MGACRGRQLSRRRDETPLFATLTHCAAGLPPTLLRFLPASLLADLLQPPWIFPSPASDAQCPLACSPFPPPCVKSQCYPAWPARPVLADAPSLPPSSLSSNVCGLSGLLSPHAPVPSLCALPQRRFRPPFIQHQISSPCCWLRSFLFFPSSGNERADESALLWILVNSPFPQWSPCTASAHLLLHHPAACQPVPAHPSLVGWSQTPLPFSQASGKKKSP